MPDPGPFSCTPLAVVELAGTPFALVQFQSASQPDFAVLL